MASFQGSRLDGVHCIILSLAPVGVPQSVLATDVQAFSLTLAWQPLLCKQKRSAIASYFLHYGPSSQYSIQQSTNITGIINTFISLSELSPMTSYTFQVGAVNTEGVDGPPSPPVTISTESERESIAKYLKLKQLEFLS